MQQTHARTHARTHTHTHTNTHTYTRQQHVHMFVHCLGVGYTYQVALRDVRALLRFRHNGTATAGAYGTLPTLPLFAGLLTHIDCFVKKEKITPITKRTNARLHAHTHARKHARTHACTYTCLLYTSPSPRDGLKSRMPSSA